MKKSQEIFLKNLISKGYFPEELPPLFSTRDFSRIVVDLINDKSMFNKEPFHSKALIITIPKDENNRRKLCIPNPHHQLLLCNAIVMNWDELQTFYKKSNFSLTRPVRKKDSTRAIERQKPFDEITRQRIIKSTASRYLLKTDVSRYYPTIYTHSISWALHGKSEAKSNIKDKNLLGNVLDLCVRNTKEQQTLGIPIGPDTSLVISEIMGTAIDLRLQESIGKLKGFRYVDDIYMYFSSLGEAEEALHHITNIFAEFELELNSQKTKIIELHNEVEPEWISELRLHTVRKNSEKDIISYFSKMMSYADKYPNDKVIKYGIKRIRGVLISEESWSIYESCLLKSALADSSTIPVILDIFLDYEAASYELDYDNIQETLNYIIELNSKFSYSYELLWSLWALYLLELKLEPRNYESLSRVNEPLVALMSLYLVSVGFLEDEFDRTLWQEHMRSDELYTDYWILAYEAYKRGWLNSVSGKDYINHKKVFDYLRNKDVSFIVDVDEAIQDYRNDARLVVDYDDSEGSGKYYGGGGGGY